METAKQAPLAHWLMETLRALDLSQNEFAEKAGVSPATLTAIRQGVTPKPETLERLAKVTGSDVETLLELAGVIRPLADLPSDIPPEGRDIVRRLMRLPAARRQDVLRMFGQLLDFAEETVEAS